MRFPNDNEMKNELKTMNFYEGLKKYSKFILGKIEEYSAKVSVDFRNPKITIEHVMPQKLDSSWEVELGSEYDRIHRTYLHNIGNLILTEFNGEMGNKPFKDKKTKLNTSSLNFRLDVINENTWDENTIQKHQSNMILRFLETFPLPSNYREKDNWNTKATEVTRFSPLAEDAGDIAEGNRPLEMRIDKGIIMVASWQDVFIKFLQYIKDNQDFDFDLILDYQSDLFGKSEVILKWASLKILIENNADLKNRYKTFDGKVLDKVKNLSDEMYFIHINISASTCMSRIANIMNKFNMTENFVEIELKL